MSSQTTETKEIPFEFCPVCSGKLFEEIRSGYRRVYCETGSEIKRINYVRI